MNTLNLEFREKSCHGQLKIHIKDKQLMIIPGVVHINDVYVEIDQEKYQCVKKEEAIQIYQLQEQSEIFYSEYMRLLESIYESLKLYSEQGQFQYNLSEEAITKLKTYNQSHDHFYFTFVVDFTVKFNNIPEFNAIEQQLPYILNYLQPNTSQQFNVLEVLVKYDNAINQFLFGQQNINFILTDYRHGVTRFILATVPEIQAQQLFSCRVIPYESARSAANAFRVPTISDIQIITLAAKQHFDIQNTGKYNFPDDVHQHSITFCFVPFTTQPAAVAAALLVRKLAAKFLPKYTKMQQYHIMDVTFKYFYIAKVSAELQLLARYESSETPETEKMQITHLSRELMQYLSILKSTLGSGTSYDDFIFFIQKQVQPYGCNFIPLDTVGSITEHISVAYIDYLDRQEQVNVMRALQITRWDKPYLPEKQQAVVLQTAISELLNDFFGSHGAQDVFDYAAFPEPIQKGQSFTLQAYWNQINGKSGQYEFSSGANEHPEETGVKAIDQQETEHGVEGFSEMSPHPLTLFLEPVSGEETVQSIRIEQLRVLDDYERFINVRLINHTEMYGEARNALLAACKMEPYPGSRYRHEVMVSSSRKRLGQAKYIHLVSSLEQALFSSAVSSEAWDFLNIEIYLQTLIQRIEQNKFTTTNVQTIANIRFPLIIAQIQLVESKPRIVKDPRVCDVQASSMKSKIFYETLKPYYIDSRWYALFSWSVWLRQLSTGQESLAAFDYALRNGARNARIGISVLYERRLDSKEPQFSFTRALLRSKCLLDRSREARILEQWLLDLQEIEIQLRGTSLNVQLMNSGRLAQVQRSAVEFLITAGDTAFFLNAASYLSSIRHFNQKEVGFLIATLAPGLIRLIQQLFIIFGVQTILRGTEESIQKGTIGLEALQQADGATEQQNNVQPSTVMSSSPVLQEYLRSQQNVHVPTGKDINDFICTATHLLVSSLGGQTTPAILYCLEAYPYAKYCDLSRFLFNKFSQIKGKLQKKSVNAFILSQLRLYGWDLTTHFYDDVEIELLCFHLSLCPDLAAHPVVWERVCRVLVDVGNEESGQDAPEGSSVHRDALLQRIFNALIIQGQVNISLTLLLSILANEVVRGGNQDQAIKRNYAQYELLAKTVGPYHLTHTHFINYNAKLLNIMPSFDSTESGNTTSYMNWSGLLSPQTRLCEQCVFGSCTCSQDSSVQGINYDSLHDQLDDVLRIFSGLKSKKSELSDALPFQSYKTSGLSWDFYKNISQIESNTGVGFKYICLQKMFMAVLLSGTFQERLRAVRYLRVFVGDRDAIESVYLQLFTGFSLPLKLLDKQVVRKVSLRCSFGERNYCVFEKVLPAKDAAKKK